MSVSDFLAGPAEEAPVSDRAARSRFVLPVLLAAAAVTAVAVAMPAAAAPPAPAGPAAAATAGDRGAAAWAAATLARMTLEEKVGQLFVTYAYGATADTTAAADVAANRAAYGIDNADQLIDRYRLG